MKIGTLLLQNVHKVGRFEGYIPGPAPESAVVVDCLDPFIQESVLRVRLVGLLAFDFQYQHDTVGQPDEKIGSVFLDDASVDVQDFEAQMIVFDPRIDIANAGPTCEENSVL